MISLHNSDKSELVAVDVSNSISLVSFRRIRRHFPFADCKAELW
jgi:hypothetical protein